MGGKCHMLSPLHLATGKIKEEVREVTISQNPSISIFGATIPLTPNLMEVLKHTHTGVHHECILAAEAVIERAWYSGHGGTGWPGLGSRSKNDLCMVQRRVSVHPRSHPCHLHPGLLPLTAPQKGRPPGVWVVTTDRGFLQPHGGSSLL